MDNLRDLRRSRGLAMDALGMLAGCDAATISRIENGKVRASNGTVVRLATTLGVSARRMRRLCDAALPSMADAS
ncbi:helix-turn-helix domain-containing protein [Arsenicicoccus bolidensis]|nr:MULTISPECIES: helix-turn-helix transcriptional regulator [Arsenicicoccus]